MADGADWEIPVRVALACLLGVGSATFSGLTLGLMTLDVMQLKLLIDCAAVEDVDKQTAKYAVMAKRIYRVRKDGNFLLVTLLMGNVMVNSALSITLGDLAGGWIGFAVSTSVITVFGEILPQAICTRYGLIVGYYLFPLVVFFELLFFIIAKPIALILDKMLGQEMGTRFTRSQLKALVNLHQKEANVLTKEEARIIGGGLEFAMKSAEAAMTPMADVFGVDMSDTFSFAVASSIIASGFSRIPVFDKTKKQSVVGMLLVKDLLLLDPSHGIPIKTLLNVFGRTVYAVEADTRLFSLLTDFKKGRTHLAVVRRVEEDPSGGDPYYLHVGIITLEDIIEEILQDEIVDEFERIGPSEKGFPDSQRPHEAKSVLHAQEPRGGRRSEEAMSAALGRVTLLDDSRSVATLEQNETIAVALFLTATQPAFSRAYIRQDILRSLLSSSSVVVVPADRPLYTRNQTATFAALVLHGRLGVISGSECFEALLPPWSFVGAKALGPPPLSLITSVGSTIPPEFAPLSRWERENEWKPDFTAGVPRGERHLPGAPQRAAGRRAPEEVRVLKVTRGSYLRAVEASLLNREGHRESVAWDGRAPSFPPAPTSVEADPPMEDSPSRVMFGNDERGETPVL